MGRRPKFTRSVDGELRCTIRPEIRLTEMEYIEASERAKASGRTLNSWLADGAIEFFEARCGDYWPESVEQAIEQKIERFQNGDEWW